MTTVETATGPAKTMVLNMGPQHPSTHGVLRVALELDGETVVKADPDLGYLHTGIEKSCEHKTYSQAITLTDRMDYLNPLGNNLVYCLAVEKLLGLEVPKRAQYIRVMMVELQRISSHLVWLGTHAIDMGAMSVFLYCFREREEILKIFERFAGQRMMTSYIRIGGVALEPPAGWREMIGKFLKMMPSRVDEYEALLTENRIWQGRLQGVGKISLEQAIAYSMSGPTLRAAGLAHDNRKVFPYSSYEEFKFDVPTRTDSDCYGRYLLRVAEIRESLKIVKQAMDKITDSGPIRTEAPGIVPPPREKMKVEMEALIYHFKIFTEGFSPPPGDAYVAIESPRGELGCYIASDGSPKPLRCHFRSPSYVNLQALPLLIQGQLIADVIACIGTIDIVLGDVDR
ncbi:MAG TPA: NADH dehydrogenase (quinone) subunit D [Candidatus Acidoferrum sp.]|nr:NADH dehydrogenase (quinone) subunit D [Candidatus Acidoferrum sp.]